VKRAAVKVTTRGGPFAGATPATMRRRAEKMLRHLRLRGVELSVALVDDATIHALNRTYRRKDKPTDVLAFPMQDPAPPRPSGLLGDVIVSVDTARRQAARRRRPLVAELTMLLAHGLLHLLGYDHRNDAEDREMTARTRELEEAAVGRGRRAAGPGGPRRTAGEKRIPP
jgi:probable rRNA maturation factor